jgi:hypothetical protein
MEKLMTTIFARYDEGRSNELKIASDEITWPELADEFVTFLQGCGYVVDHSDLAEHFAEHLRIGVTMGDCGMTFADGDIGPLYDGEFAFK